MLVGRNALLALDLGLHVVDFVGRFKFESDCLARKGLDEELHATAQTQDKELQARFSKVAKQLQESEAKILAELKAAQGRPVDIGGYFRPNAQLTAKAMRPSATLNAIVDAVS